MKNYRKIALCLLVSTLLFGCSITDRFTDPPPEMNPATFLRVSPGYAAVGTGEEVRFTEVELDSTGSVVSSNITCSLKTKEKDAAIQANGTFSASSAGEYLLEFKSTSSVTRSVPVTVVPNSQEYLAQMLMDFTYAAETQDFSLLEQYVANEFLIVDNVYGNGSQTESLEHFKELCKNIVSWSISGITIEEHDSSATMSGTAELETRHFVDDHAYFSIMTCMITLVIDTSQNPAKITEMWFDRLPPDISNPPDVKAIIHAPPAGTVLQDDTFFEYTVGVRNLGGSGYYVIFDRVEYPGGGSSNGFGYTKPSWISSNGSYESVLGTGVMLNAYGTNRDAVTIEVIIVSGPSPNDLVPTDHIILTYKVQVDPPPKDWPWM